MLAMGNGHAVPSRRAGVRSASARCVGSVSAGAHGATVTSAKHLIVEANGVFGYPGNWDVINQYMTQRLDMDHYIIHASKVNQKTEVRSERTDYLPCVR